MEQFGFTNISHYIKWVICDYFAITMVDILLHNDIGPDNPKALSKILVNLTPAFI